MLKWSEWVSWSDLKVGSPTRAKIDIATLSGVYEAKHIDGETRLTIGETTNLKRRIKKQLVRGKHSAGRRIVANEDLSTIVVRWAVTRDHKVEQAALHILHIAQFGDLPTHTKRT